MMMAMTATLADCSILLLTQAHAEARAKVNFQSQSQVHDVRYRNLIRFPHSMCDMHAYEIDTVPTGWSSSSSYGRQTAVRLASSQTEWIENDTHTPVTHACLLYLFTLYLAHLPHSLVQQQQQHHRQKNTTRKTKRYNALFLRAGNCDFMANKPHVFAISAWKEWKRKQKQTLENWRIKSATCTQFSFVSVICVCNVHMPKYYEHNFNLVFGFFALPLSLSLCSFGCSISLLDMIIIIYFTCCCTSFPSLCDFAILLQLRSQKGV